MSTEFKGIRLYRRPDEETNKFVKDAHYFLLTLPELKEGQDYQVAFAECLINQLQDLMQSISNNSHRDDYGKLPAEVRNENGIPLELKHQMSAVADILQYMVNSTSWRTGQYRSFDAVELKNRLERAALYSNIALRSE